MVCRCWLWGFLCQEDASTLGHDSLPQSTWSPRHLFYLLGQLLLFFFFLFSSFFPTSAHTLSNLLSANRLSFMTRPSSFSHPVTVYHSWLVLFLLSSHLHHNLPPLTAGATWRSHVTLECVMLEPCVGAGRKDWKKKPGLDLQRHSSVCGWLWKLSTWHGPNGRRHEERDVSRRGNGRWWWVGK